MEKIRRLRQDVAKIIEEAYINSREMFGVNIHSCVQEEHKTLKAYIEDIKGSQWASQAEMAAMCEALDISLFFHMPDGWLKLGTKKPKYIMKLMNEHYTLWRCRGKPKHEVAHVAEPGRGGMMPTQTVGNRQPDELSLFEVTIAAGFPTDVSSLVVRARASDGVKHWNEMLDEPKVRRDFEGWVNGTSACWRLLHQACGDRHRFVC